MLHFNSESSQSKIKYQHFVTDLMTKRKSIFKLILLGFSAIIFAGCATTLPLSQEAKDSIRSVSISENISLPESMFYHGGGQTLGMLFGAVGGAVTGIATQRPAEQIKAFMKISDINVDDMIKNAFKDNLSQTSAFNILESGASDAHITIEINIYGLIQVHGYSSRLRPIMAIQGEMTDSNGKVLWIGNSSTPAFTSNLPAHTLNEYANNPELLKDAFVEASSLVTSSLIADMIKN